MTQSQQIRRFIVALQEGWLGYQKTPMITVKDKIVTGGCAMRIGMGAPPVFALARKSGQVNQEMLVNRRVLALEAGMHHYGKQVFR